jgi:hypothetical protein
MKWLNAVIKMMVGPSRPFYRRMALNHLLEVSYKFQMEYEHMKETAMLFAKY